MGQKTFTPTVALAIFTIRELMRRGNVLVASVSVCLSVCNARTFDSLDLESSFLVRAATSSEYLGHVRISRSSGQGQGHRSKTACLYLDRVWSDFDWKAVLLRDVFKQNKPRYFRSKQSSG